MIAAMTITTPGGPALDVEAHAQRRPRRRRRPAQPAHADRDGDGQRPHEHDPLRRRDAALHRHARRPAARSTTEIDGQGRAAARRRAGRRRRRSTPTTPRGRLTQPARATRARPTPTTRAAVSRHHRPAQPRDDVHVRPGRTARRADAARTVGRRYDYDANGNLPRSRRPAARARVRVHQRATAERYTPPLSARRRRRLRVRQGRPANADQPAGRHDVTSPTTTRHGSSGSRSRAARRRFTYAPTDRPARRARPRRRREVRLRLRRRAADRRHGRGTVAGTITRAYDDDFRSRRRPSRRPPVDLRVRRRRPADPRRRADARRATPPTAC